MPSSPHCIPGHRARRRPDTHTLSCVDAIEKGQLQHSSLELATAHVLTALYSITNRVALTNAERKALRDHGTALSPALWEHTRAVLKLVDRTGAQFELGFMPEVFAWLGVADEAAFVERYEVGVNEALERDRGHLFACATALDRSQAQEMPLDLAISHAWSARALRLVDGLPQTGKALLTSLDLALDGCRWELEWVRPTFDLIVKVATLVGDRARLSEAQKMLARIDQESGAVEGGSLPIGVAAQCLTALWCVTHEGCLLEEERDLVSTITPSQFSWPTVVDDDGSWIDGLAVPMELLIAWGAPEDVEAATVRECLQRCASVLPEFIVEIERLWGGVDSPGVSDQVARAVLSLALVRHQQLHQAFRPLVGEQSGIWQEVHQSYRRPSTVERSGLIRDLWPVLLRGRGELDPLLRSVVHLDRASESQVRGAHDETRSHLAEAMHWTARYEGAEQSHRDYGAVCFARHLWLTGEPEEAMATVRCRELEGEQASDLLQTLQAHEVDREVLRQAEKEHLERGDIDSARAVVRAHVAAGHSIRAEVLARDACRRYPDDYWPWNLLAWVLFVVHRYRDAVAPCREALSKGLGTPSGVSLLARVLSHIGPEGRAESVRLAVEAIQADDAREVLPSGVLAELAEIVHYAGPDISPARQADDLVWDMRADDPPGDEWIGAAASRRCHGVWAKDAPQWLSRLADAGKLAPAALARFVVERVEALVWWISTIQDQVDALAHDRRDQGDPDWLDDPDPGIVREAAVAVALRAAIALGYAEADPDDASAPTEAELERNRSWQPHLPAVRACFGDLVIRMRASQEFQDVLVPHDQDQLSEVQLLVIRRTFENELIDWIRWTGETAAIADLDAIPGLTPAMSFSARSWNHRG